MTNQQKADSGRQNMDDAKRKPSKEEQLQGGGRSQQMEKPSAVEHQETQIQRNHQQNRSS